MEFVQYSDLPQDAISVGKPYETTISGRVAQVQEYKCVRFDPSKVVQYDQVGNISLTYDVVTVIHAILS